MAYDEELAAILRADLVHEGVTEKKMFGGLAFLFDGNMVCGIHKGGAMFRVGKAAHAEAMAIPGVAEMDFTGHPMQGFVGVDEDLMQDDARRGRLMAMSLATARALPPKLAKPAKSR